MDAHRFTNGSWTLPRTPIAAGVLIDSNVIERVAQIEMCAGTGLSIPECACVDCLARLFTEHTPCDCVEACAGCVREATVNG